MNTFRTACAALAIGCLALAATAHQRFDFDSTPGLLSKDVRPQHYALSLTLDPGADRFDGEATISLTVRKPVPAIVLHAHELTARSATLLMGLTGAVERPLTVQADTATQTWRLLPVDGHEISAGAYRLRLAYAGTVQHTDSGLYSAPHQAFGKPVRMLATQMQAAFARMLFPVFDEPAFRSVFELTVRAPKGYEVVSNMPAAARARAGGDEGAQVLHRFAPTPPMPSYLVAVAVGRFDALTGHAAGVPLRVLTAPGKRALAAHALATTQKVLPFYNQYFGVPYALPKLDQLAVPSGRQGAMEDWGLISYAESALLFDPVTSDLKTKRRIFSIVAHEVSHQWFGNLVTASSWEEIWLNEAFATWLAEKATDRFNPDWQVPLNRRTPIDTTMARDAGTATRAIRSGAVPEDRVFDVFDNITYVKGGAVLSMLELWIGPEAFRRGLSTYMRAQRFSNATAGDLWFHIGRAAGRDVAAVAASWTDQPGFPLVSVASRCEGDRTRIDVTQQRFSTAGDAAGNINATADASRWKIPLRLLHDGRTTTLLLDREQQTLTLPGCPALPPLANPGGEGFYRVAYAPAQQAALAQRFAQLPPAARITLLSDTLALAQAGQLPMTAYLDLLAVLPHVKGAGTPALWAMALNGLAFLDDAFAGTPTQASLHVAARALLAPELAALGWAPQAGEASEIEALRGSLIRGLARYGDRAVIERAGALFDADEAGTRALPASLRASVIEAAATRADARRFAQLLARLKSAQREEDQWLYASAVAAVDDAALANQVLALSLQGELPAKVAAELPGLLTEHRHHQGLAYRYTVDHWAALADLAGTMFGASAWLLPGAAGGFNQRDDAQRLLADQQRLAGAPGAAAAATAAARIELLAAVQAREAERLHGVLLALPQRLPPREPQARAPGLRSLAAR